MKIFKIKLIIFSLLFISINRLMANVVYDNLPHPEPKPHTLSDIQQKKHPSMILELTVPKPPQETKSQRAKAQKRPVRKAPIHPSQPKVPAAATKLKAPAPPQVPSVTKSQVQQVPVEEATATNSPSPQATVPKPQAKAAIATPKKSSSALEKTKVKESESAKVYNNPVYIGVVEKSFKTIMEDSLENANANLRQVKRYWMTEAKLHPEIKREIDIFQELNNAFIAYLNAMYMLDRMQDPDYYQAKKFYEYALSEATNVLFEFREHGAKLKIALEDFIEDIELELASVNDIIEPR